MNIGKMSENSLKRSVLRQITYNRDEVVKGAEYGSDYSALKLSDDELYITAVSSMSLKCSNIGRYAVCMAVNNVAVAGAGAVAIMLSVLVPEDTEESEIKTLMKQVNDTCKELDVQVIGGHTQVTDAVNRIVIDVTGIGKVNKDSIISSSGAAAGDDIVVTKWIGSEGAAIIAADNENELKERFSTGYIEEAKKSIGYVSIASEASIAAKMGASAMHDASFGGLFGALWELAQSSDVGMEVDLKDIPIKQETIEIADYYDVNPYELLSGGSLIVCMHNGHDYVRSLKAIGINASVVGKITSGKDRVIINGEERRFLTRPSVDEIFKVTNK